MLLPVAMSVWAWAWTRWASYCFGGCGSWETGPVQPATVGPPIDCPSDPGTERFVRSCFVGSTFLRAHGFGDWQFKQAVVSHSRQALTIATFATSQTGFLRYQGRIYLVPKATPVRILLHNAANTTPKDQVAAVTVGSPSSVRSNAEVWLCARLQWMCYSMTALHDIKRLSWAVRTTLDPAVAQPHQP